MNHWFPGGHICALRGERVGLAFYESQGRTMSLFMGDPKLLGPPSSSPRASSMPRTIPPFLWWPDSTTATFTWPCPNSRWPS